MGSNSHYILLTILIILNHINTISACIEEQDQGQRSAEEDQEFAVQVDLI